MPKAILFSSRGSHVVSPEVECKIAFPSALWVVMRRFSCGRSEMGFGCVAGIVCAIDKWAQSDVRILFLDHGV